MEEVILEEIPFDKALENLKKGKPIHWFSPNQKEIREFSPLSFEKEIKLSFRDILEGNWAIERQVIH